MSAKIRIASEVEELAIRHKLGIRIIDPTEFEGRQPPARRWLVDGLIPMGAVTLLSGDGGLGKSLIGLQLMASCATGKPWLGQPVQRCKSFGIFCEDEADEIHRRLADIANAMAIPWAGLDGMKAISRVGADNLLMTIPSHHDTGVTTPLYDWLLGYVKSEGVQLTIVDTVVDVFGGNENCRSQVGAFINVLRRIALEIDGAVLLMAHPSVAGLINGSGISGSTAWNNSVRSRLFLTRSKADGDGDKDPDVRVLRGMKSNYAAKAGEIRMRWIDGVFEPEGGQSMTDRAANESAADRVFLDGMSEMATRDQVVSPATGKNYAPKLIAEWPPAKGIPKSALKAAMERLTSSLFFPPGVKRVFGQF